MNKGLIYTKFLKRAENLEVVDNLYSDTTFSHYYKEISEDDEVLNTDVQFYSKYLDIKDTILEIGSGTGRIFNKLYTEKYDIYGMEPSEEMSRYIVLKGQERIFHLTLQEVEKLPISHVEVIIIPATSVCLFSHSDLEIFLKNLICRQPFIKKIIFDFMKESFFEISCNHIQTTTINSEKYFFVNFMDEKNERIIFNLMNSKKIGISIKYLYNLEKIKKIFNKFDITINVLENVNDYVMVEGVFNGNKSQ